MEGGRTERPCGVVSEDLPQDRAEVRQVLAVARSRGAAAFGESVDFRLRFLLDFGVLRHQNQEGLDRGRCLSEASF